MLAADEEVRRVWAAILLHLPDCVSATALPARGRVRLERPPRPNEVSLEAACVIASTCGAFITATPGPKAMEAVQRAAAFPSWSPESYERYAAALREPDPALQLVALYGAALEAIRSNVVGREPTLMDLDHELEVRFHVPKLPAEGPRGAEESPFTRARTA